MKKKILIAWSCMHLLFIFLINLTGSFNVYYEFNHKNAESYPVTTLANWLGKPPISYYGRYTGAETGYGFFGVNVRSNGLLLGECDGRKLSPEFNSYETSLRFFSMANAITDDYLKPPASTNNDSLRNKETISSVLNILILKNIAFTLYKKYNCADTSMLVNYNLLEFPSLSEIRQGASKKYTLLNLLSLRFSLHQHDPELKKYIQSR